MFTRRGGWVILAACCGLSACVLDLKTPDGAVIACSANDDCPANLVCRTNVQRCLPADAPSSPPTVTAAGLSPRIGTRGSRFTLELSVSERLASPPTIAAESNGAAVPFELASHDGDRSYSFHYTVTPVDAEGDYRVTAHLVDIYGNEAELSVGDLSLDFTRPALSAPQWNLPAGKTAARPTEQVPFSARMESSARVTSLVVRDEAQNELQTLPVPALEDDPTTPGFSILSGALDLSTLPGPVSNVVIEVTAADSADNTQTRTSVALPVRGQAPTNPTLLIEDKPVLATQSATIVLFAGDATEVFVAGDVIPTSSTFTWIAMTPTMTVTLSAGDGNKVVTAKFRDAAWNETTLVSDDVTLATGPVSSAPVLTGPAQQTKVKNGDLLFVDGQGEAGASVVSARLVSVGPQTTAQQLPAGAVSIDLLGRLSGAFVASGLVHDDSIVLEVILHARGVDSIATSSRSLPLSVDNAAPTNATVSVVEGGTVGVTGVSVSLSAIGANQVFLDGDVDDGANVRQWLALSSPLSLTLSNGDGGKAIIARFRDDAHNTVQALATVSLDTSVPQSAPIITGPWGVATVKDGDTVVLSGETTSATTTSIVSAHVVSLDASGNLLSGGGCQTDVSSQCQLTNGGFSGSFSIGTPCVGAARVAVRVVVQNAAGIQSVAAASLSNELALDNSPPSASASQLVTGRTLAGNAPSTDVRLAVTASDGGGHPVQMLILGDLTASARTGGWVDFPGPVVGQEQIALTPSQGPKSVSVKFRDVVHNETTPEVLTITLDTLAPTAPLATALVLVEESAQPTNPLVVADDNNTFTLRGQAGAVVGADRIDVYGATGPTQLLTENAVAVQPDGSFANQVFSYVPGETYYAVAVDAAGNTSPATAINTPRVLAFNLPALPSRAGVPVVMSFDSPPLAGTPRLVLDDRDATFQSSASCGGGCTRYTYTFTPSAVTEPEGLNQCVARMIGQDGRNLYGSGTEGTDATTITFDFHGPTIDDPALVATEADPGTQDSIAGQAGAVSDAISPTAPTGTLVIYASDGGALAACNPCIVNADGSFGPILLGDNAHDSVQLSFRDQAGNATLRTITFDRGPPAITGLTVSPGTVKEGDTVTVTFSVSDAHDLRTQPVVTLAGRSAAWVSGSTQTGSGTQAFTYELTIQNADPDGRQLVSVIATDAVGNARTAQTPLVVDKTAPTSTITWPTADGTWNGAPSTFGTATDGAGTGVASVAVSLRDNAAGLYWNGSAFAASSETYVAVAGTSAWSFAVLALPLTTGHDYTLTSRSTDAAGNQETPTSTRTFTYNESTQAAPTGLTGVSQGEAKIHLSWTAPITGAPISYRLYYDSELAARPPYGGTGASQGGSPLTIAGGATSFDVTELPRGRYAFALSAVGPSGESTLSNEVTAASRWWINTLAPLSRHTVTSATWVDDAIAVAVGPSGTVWRTTDRGSSFVVLGSGTTQDLLTVGATGDTVIAAGQGGTILRSQNAGATFATVTSPTSFALRCMSVQGSDVLLAGSGGTVLYSTNGGASFNTATVSDPPASSFHSIWRNGATVILGTVSSGIYVSTNGGQTVARSSITANGPFLVAGSGANVVAAANGLIATSHDGGATWTSVPIVANFTSVVAASSTRFLAGSSTTVRSIDMSTVPATIGIAYASPGVPLEASIGLIATSTGVIALDNGSAHRSTAGGESWLQLASPSPPGTRQPIVTRGSDLLASSSNAAELVVSHDDAETWSVTGGAVTASNIIGVAQGTGALVAFDASGALRSDTDGDEWLRVFAPGGTPAWTAVWGQGSEFIAVGANSAAGKAAHSTNGGLSWNVLDIPTFAAPGALGISNCVINKILPIGNKRLALGTGLNASTIPMSSALCYSEYQGFSWLQSATVMLPPQPNAPTACFTAVTDGTISMLGGYSTTFPGSNGLYVSPNTSSSLGSAGSFGSAFYRNIIAGAGTQWIALSGSINIPGVPLTSTVEAAASTTSGSTWGSAGLGANDYSAAWASGSTFLVGGKNGVTPTIYRSSTGPAGPWTAIVVTGITETIGGIVGSGSTLLVYDIAGHLAVSTNAGVTWTQQTHFAPGTSTQSPSGALLLPSGEIILTAQNGTILQLGP